MIRSVLFSVLVLGILPVQNAFAGPGDRPTAGSNLTTQIDGFAGPSGTGKTVRGGSAGASGLGTTR